METVLITGAASGIARATAKRLSKRMKIIAADRDADGLKSLIGEIEADGGEATAIEVDVADAASVRAMFDRIDGPIDAGFFDQFGTTSR